MQIEKIEDHSALMKARLLAQFKGQENWGKLFDALGGRYQGLEDVLYALLSDRDIEDAVGAQLVGLASILGTERPSSGTAADDEEDFRSYLRAKIVANRSEGDPSELYKVLEHLGRERTQLVELAYAYEEQTCVRLAVNNELVVGFPDTMKLLRQAAPTGVRVELSGNEVWWHDRLWGDDDVWPEYRYTDGLWNPDGIWAADAYWGGDLVA